MQFKLKGDPMTTITLPPDLGDRLAREASRRGTTPESLALEELRRAFLPMSVGEDAPGVGTLFDFLDGQIGLVAGSSEPLSEDCGSRFAEGLTQDRGESGS